jgi:hypothetical protein
MSRRLLTIALSAFAGALMLPVSAVVKAWATSAPLPTLLQGVKSDSFPFRGKPGEFDQRIKERFPVGSSEAALVRELWVEGFYPVTPLDAATRQAHFERLGNLSDLARRDASVSWTADDKGRLMSIEGHFSIQLS